MSDKEKAWSNPVFAKELLAGIKLKVETGATLSDVEREYLSWAIGRVLEVAKEAKAKGEPEFRADRALGLVASLGRSAETFSDMNVRIFNRVEALIALGNKKAYAFRYIAEELARDPGKFSEATAELKPGVIYADSAGESRRVVGVEAVRKIYEAIKKELSVK